MGVHEVISRSEAIARGLKFYCTGKPCKNGHIAIRRTNDCICSACQKILRANWREANREQHNSWGKRNPTARKKAQDKYLEAHPDRHRTAQMTWLNNNREQNREYQRKLKKRLRQTSENYRLRCNLRGRIHKAIRRGDGLKAGRTLDLIGCTVAELRTHLEGQFTAGMIWANYGHGPGKWNIDHVVPCAAFDLSDPVQQRACFHFTNLQPLWHVLNVAKGAYHLASIAAH